MPFSWKKGVRRNRFSQLVADHLQSPKHGGSLVVETGFPTSLIDLYVRNRGRFRKSSVKKQNEYDSGLLVESISLPSFSSSRCSLVDLSELASDLAFGGECESREFVKSGEIVEEGVDMVVSEDKVEVFVEEDVELSVEMAKLNPVLAVVVKVLVVVVLVLGTKRFTFGITMSAFVLLLLELIGKVLFGRSSSLSVDSEARAGSSCRETENVVSLKEDTSHTTIVGCRGGLEIEEEVESNQEVRSEKDADEVRSEGSMEVKPKSSRRAIMKSRMKKLVPKKLRKSSMGSKEDISYGLIEEEDHKTSGFSSECSDSKGETLRILKQNQGQIVKIEERSLVSTLSSETDCNGKNLERGLHQNSGCLVLCLIVLVGLIGGRILALVLALSWCLVLKKLQWRNVKFPIS